MMLARAGVALCTLIFVFGQLVKVKSQGLFTTLTEDEDRSTGYIGVPPPCRFFMHLSYVLTTMNTVKGGTLKYLIPSSPLPPWNYSNYFHQISTRTTLPEPGEG